MAETIDAPKRVARDVPQKVLDAINRVDWEKVSESEMKLIEQGIEHYLIGLKYLPLKF